MLSVGYEKAGDAERKLEAVKSHAVFCEVLFCQKKVQNIIQNFPTKIGKSSKHMRNKLENGVKTQGMISQNSNL